MTLRSPYEVRKEDEYFDDIADEKIPKDMLELASHIVDTKSGHFDPEKFEDHYEDALKELLKKKQSGQKIEAPRERTSSKATSWMLYVEAWRRRAAASGGNPSGARLLITGPEKGGTLQREAQANRLMRCDAIPFRVALG